MPVTRFCHLQPTKEREMTHRHGHMLLVAVAVAAAVAIALSPAEAAVPTRPADTTAPHVASGSLVYVRGGNVWRPERTAPAGAASHETARPVTRTRPRV